MKPRRLQPHRLPETAVPGISQPTRLPQHPQDRQEYHQLCRQLRHDPVLADVAAAVGFYDQSALNKHFKRCYGITPLQFARAAAA